MRSNRSLSEIAAKVLAAEASRPVQTSHEDRARVIAAIAKAMGERKRRQRLKWRAMGAFAIAASVAVGLARNAHRAPGDATAAQGAAAVPTAAASFVRGSPVVVRRGARQQVFDGKLIEAGDRLVVDPGSRTTVAFSNGTYLLVSERSDLVLASAAPSTTLELDAGSVHADVAKLKAHERFVIRTSDAEIEVHGTSFDVTRVAADPACGSGTTTRVSVREGTVSVRAFGTETFVHANEVWPSCSPVTAIPRSSATAAPTVANDPPSAAPPPNLQARRMARPPASDLAAQNDQFEKAVTRKRTGDVVGAITAFDEFLERHPSSHLAQSARAERMKLLRGVDPGRARAAARAYLDTYPNGFARRDAELILATD